MRYVVLFSFLMLTFAFGNPIAALEQTPVTKTQLAARVAKSYSVPCAHVAVNVPNQTLGGFDVEVVGESITVSKIAIEVRFGKGSGIIPAITNAALVNKYGAVVADQVDMKFIEGSNYLLFTNTITFPTGKETYRVQATIGTTAQNGDEITLATTPNAQWIDGRQMNSGKRIEFNSETLTANTMTVQKGALRISVVQHPPNPAVTPGTTNLVFASYVLDATQSGEDVGLSSLYLTLTTEGKAGGDAREITNMQLWDGEICLMTGSNVVNPWFAKERGAQEYLHTFDKRLVVPKGTAKILTHRGNISSSSPSGSSFSWGISASNNIEVIGITSGNDIPETIEVSSGQPQIVGMPIDSGPPVPSPMSSPMPSVPFGCNPGDAPVVYSGFGPPDYMSAVSNAEGFNWLLLQEVQVMKQLENAIKMDNRSLESTENIQTLWNSLCTLRNAVHDRICSPQINEPALSAEIVQRWYKLYIMRPTMDNQYNRWLRTNGNMNQKG